MDLGIRDHVAIVTGGGRGLGESMCMTLAKEGCKVAVWDRDLKAARAVANRIKAEGGDALAVGGDVSKRTAVAKAVGSVVRKFGQIHILVNAAGFSRDAPLTEMTDAQWGSVIGVCLTGSFLVSQAVAKEMIRKRYGRIINISSRAHLGEYMKANYSAAKAGLIGLTSSMALDLGQYDITVNAIAPGLIRTERVKALRNFKAMEKRSIARTLIPRGGEPEDVSDGLLYLASKRAGWVTGEVLYITGGRYSSN